MGDVNGLYWTRLDNRKRKGPEFSGPFVLSGTKLDYDLSGDEGDRTPDLSVANAALSQLSYTPILSKSQDTLRCLLRRSLPKRLMGHSEKSL